ncbi:DNA polymerase III subunit delta' [Candidatus Kinetoplastibacterium desouzaii TCC079E]|uniref:DNA polymerase III subunit delta n=1 Tax=Candidatus Kinetoplastidibacterium desouzai TCC079E TaxID=1208919 RepID=M1M3S2_9PROT|nr:DNA polymerase III subunit delta' [Candidatus Kinetoplastibacterium desouzaii]AGF46895.1 DNA polymerase III subunit delta' [Candidatus Kinetoplastibacterium desouzaii TCC079E]
MISCSFFPWQFDLAAQWLKNIDRIHHAWLINGLNGIGKFEFSTSFAATILCENLTNNFACCHCVSCNLIKNNNHPDIKFLLPDALSGLITEDCNDNSIQLSNEIRIDQIRDIIPWINITPYRNNKKIIIIYKTNNLNIVSSNALLKIIEEPPPNVIIIIVADYLEGILPTIISRCQRIYLPIPNNNISLDWLNKNNVNNSKEWLSFTGGAPINAFYYSKKRDNPCHIWIKNLLDMLSNDIKVPIYSILEDNYDTIIIPELIEIFQKIFFDLIMIIYGFSPKYFINLENIFKKLSCRTNKEICINIFIWLNNKSLLSNYKLNKKVFANNILQKTIESFK